MYQFYYEIFCLIIYSLFFRYLNVAQNKIERLPLPSENKSKKRYGKKDPTKHDYGCQVLEEIYLQVNIMT